MSVAAVYASAERRLYAGSYRGSPSKHAAPESVRHGMRRGERRTRCIQSPETPCGFTKVTPIWKVDISYEASPSIVINIIGGCVQRSCQGAVRKRKRVLGIPTRFRLAAQLLMRKSCAGAWMSSCLAAGRGRKLRAGAAETTRRLSQRAANMPDLHLAIRRANWRSGCGDCRCYAHVRC